MRREALPFVLLAVLSVAGACGGGAEDGPAGGTDSQYGWTELGGARVGAGAAQPSELRKPITVNVLGSGGYVIGKGFAMRVSPTSQGASVVVAIANKDKELRCYVKAQPWVWRTSTGAALPSSLDFNFVHGSLGMYTGSGNLADSCLGPGEHGYLLDVREDSARNYYDELAAVDVQFADVSDRAVHRPDFRFVAKSYAFANGQLSVPFHNEGTGAAPHHSGLSTYVLLDGDGLPLFWSFLAVTDKKRIEPGETVTATDNQIVNFQGASSRLELLLAF
jgi:hypothetical protein